MAQRQSLPFSQTMEVNGAGEDGVCRVQVVLSEMEGRPSEDGRTVDLNLDLLAQADTRKVAILGDMFELGEDSVRLHEEVAEYAVETGIEHIIFVGEQARHMFRAADRKIGIGRRGELVQHIYQYPTVEDCIEDLAVDAEYFFQKGCTILLKASHGMEFTKILDFLKSIPALPEFR